jgi:hypothetical protein
MSGISVTLPTAFSDAASGMVTSAVDQAIQKLAAHFNFSAEEARAYIDKISVEPELLTAKDLPFCGQRIPGCCNGIAFRCGLYSQCPKKPQQDGLCRACWTQKEETGSLKYGTIDDRLAKPAMEFADGKVAPFARLMTKNGWTKKYVEDSAAALGWVVPPENFVVVKPKRERAPKKMEPRVLPPVEDDAEDEIKTTLVNLGVISPQAVSPKKVPHGNDDELDEEPEPIGNVAEVSATEPEPKSMTGVTDPTQDDDHKRGRKGRDYTKLSKHEVNDLNPSTLRTACIQNGIEVDGKKPAALRVELINKLV